MKRNTNLKIWIFFIVLTLGTVVSLMAQSEECACREDVAFLIKKIKKTPAFKVDYKGDKKSFDLKADLILSKTPLQLSKLACFKILNETLDLVNDLHNTVTYSGSLTETDYKTEEGLEMIKNSAHFKMYGFYEGDLDSLKNSLKAKSFDSEEGIYNYGNYISLGIFEKEAGTLQMVVLNSQAPLWNSGELIGELIRDPYANYKAIMGSFTSKNPIILRETIKNGTLQLLGFQKDTTRFRYEKALYSDRNYVLEDLSEDLQYLKAGTFSSWYPELGEAEVFYKKVDKMLTASNIILDLRNNGGGGDRNSDLLLDILKRSKNTGKIYILINSLTGSNAEQFAIKLKEFKNVTLLGDTSKGAITYELKKPSFNLPSGQFSAYLTSEAHQEYLEYEGVGVKPDVFLDYNQDWIEQTKNYISDAVK